MCALFDDGFGSQNILVFTCFLQKQPKSRKICTQKYDLRATGQNPSGQSSSDPCSPLCPLHLLRHSFPFGAPPPQSAATSVPSLPPLSAASTLRASVSLPSHFDLPPPLDQGIAIGFREGLFYGKGHEVEFSSVSVCAKKQAKGNIMQLTTRQVCDLYITDLTIAQKIALFYSTINQFLTFYIADRCQTFFAATLVLFAVSQTVERFEFAESEWPFLSLVCPPSRLLMALQCSSGPQHQQPERVWFGLVNARPAAPPSQGV